MNLIYLRDRQDPILRMADGIERAGVTTEQGRFNGFLLPPSDEPALVLRDVLKWYPFCLRPETVGWYACADGNAKNSPPRQLTIALVDQDRSVSERTLQLGSNLSPLYVPWPVTANKLADNLALQVTTSSANTGPVFLAVFRNLEIEKFLELAQGDGVEIGPGHNPKIRASERVSVRYVEAEEQEKWAGLYTNKAQKAAAVDWSQYIIGKAHDLPVEDGSLDFVFSSHVFEHLVNPIGHLEHWLNKLKPGGRVLAMVPNLQGCMDYRSRPTPLDQWLAAYDRGGFDLRFEDYKRWSSVHGSDPRDLLNRRYSIHVSAFDRQNSVQLLEHAVRELGFSYYNLYFSENHVDFQFCLVK